MLATQDEILLWRYIFRVNSTKLQPIAWQKSNIPLGVNSPWFSYVHFPSLSRLSVRENVLRRVQGEKSKFCRRMAEI